MKDFEKIKLYIPRTEVLNVAKPGGFTNYKDATKAAVTAFEAQASDTKKALLILHQLTLEYWIASLYNKHPRKCKKTFYHKTLKYITNGNSSSAWSREESLTYYCYKKSPVKRLHKRFFNNSSAKELEYVWQVPKEVYLPQGVPTGHQKNTQVTAPFWISKDFCVHSEQKNTLACADYAWAWVDCHASPLRLSDYQDNIIKHIALAMQTQVEHNPTDNADNTVYKIKQTSALVKGGTLIISGIPSSDLLDWIQCPIKPNTVDATTHDKYGDAQRFSAIEDIEVLIAIPRPKYPKSSSDDQEVLIQLKPGRNYALVCNNDLVYKGFDKKCIDAHNTRGTNYSIVNLLKNAVEYTAEIKTKKKITKEITYEQARKLLLTKVSITDQNAALEQIYNKFWENFNRACKPRKSKELSADILLTQHTFFTECARQFDKLRKCKYNKKVIKDNYNILCDQPQQGILPNLWTLAKDLHKAASYNVAEGVNREKIAPHELHSKLDNLDGNDFWLLEPVLRKQNNGLATLQRQNLTQPPIYIDQREPNDKWKTYLQLYIENVVILMLQLIPDDQDMQAKIWSKIQNETINIGTHGFSIANSVINTIVEEMIVFLNQTEVTSPQEQSPFFILSKSERSWFMVCDLLDSNFAKQRACVKRILAQHKPISSKAWSKETDAKDIYQKLYDIELLSGWSMNHWLQQTNNSPLTTHDSSFYCYDVKLIKEGAVKCIYALDIYNNLHILHESMHGNNRNYSHIQLTGGTPVHAAGEMYFRKQKGEWYLAIINNASGHYGPAKASVLTPELCAALTQLTDINIQHVQYRGHSALEDPISKPSVSHEFAEATSHAITVKG